VSWSAVVTLREAGCATVMMTTLHDRPESYAALTIPGRTVLGVPVSRRTRLVRIIGRERVEAVQVMRTDTGQRMTVACDTVVFTGDWIPDSELARLGGLDMDDGTRGPLVDSALRTSAVGVFAVGNLLHPVDTADVAALDGRHVAAQVLAHLQGAARPETSTRILAGDGLAWVSPGLMGRGDPAPARGRLLMWPTGSRRLARLEVHQGGQCVTRRRLAWPASPGRVLRAPWSLLQGVDPRAGDATVRLV
jgi:hypothetical protein